MQFRAHKRRQAPAVIIVALIDVLIVLLIFLMVTTTIRQTPSIRVDVAQSSQAHKSGATENPPLIITIDAQGGLRLGADSRPMTMEQLKAELQAQLDKKPDLSIAVNADKNSPLGEFVKVWDLAKELKVKAFNLSAKEGKAP